MFNCGSPRWYRGAVLNQSVICILSLMVFLFSTVILSGCGGGKGSDDESLNPNSMKHLFIKSTSIAQNPEPGVVQKVSFEIYNSSDSTINMLHVALFLRKLHGTSLDDVDPLQSGYESNIPVTGIHVMELKGKETRKVEMELRIPSRIANGEYAAIFMATEEFSGVDVLENYHIAYAVAGNPIVIEQPDLPNATFLSAKLGGDGGNSFTLGNRPKDNATASEHVDHILLNLEVEAVGQHILDPLEVTASINLPGIGEYPLFFPKSDGTVTNTWSPPVVCKQFNSEGVAINEGIKENGEAVTAQDQGSVCASLFNGDKHGHTFYLGLNEAAHQALQAVSKDLIGEIVIKLDPNNKINESVESDNELRLPVIYLASDSVKKLTQVPDGGNQQMNLVQNNGPYSNAIVNQIKDKTHGNDSYGVRYKFSMNSNYNRVNNVADAVYFTTENLVSVTAMSTDIMLLQFNLEFDLNVDSVTTSFFKYTFFCFDPSKKIFVTLRATKTFPGVNSSGTVTVWDTKDSETGLERFEWLREYVKEKEYSVGGIPLTVRGGFDGTFAMKGTMTFGAGNVLQFTPAVTTNVKATADLKMGIEGDWYKATLGMYTTLDMLDFTQSFPMTFQLQPGVPHSLISISSPYTASTLDGYVKAKAKAQIKILGSWEGLNETKTVLEWDGLSTNSNLFPSVNLNSP